MSIPDEEDVQPGRLDVSVRIGGDTLDPAEVTRLLGVEPSFAARKGDTIRRGSREHVQRTGIWLLKADTSRGWPLDEVLSRLLRSLPSDPGPWADLSSRFSVDVFCGLFMGTDNQGTDLSPATLGELAKRHLTFGLDVYGP